jgi:hypothetical protein
MITLAILVAPFLLIVLLLIGGYIFIRASQRGKAAERDKSENGES